MTEGWGVHWLADTKSKHSALTCCCSTTGRSKDATPVRAGLPAPPFGRSWLVPGMNQTAQKGGVVGLVPSAAAGPGPRRLGKTWSVSKPAPVWPIRSCLGATGSHFPQGTLGTTRNRPAWANWGQDTFRGASWTDPKAFSHDGPGSPHF